MIRNLDLTALRAFVAVNDYGGVTRAAGHLHVTQSAVSMQLKRLEEALGQNLFDRSGRSLVPTAQGELLISYGRRLLELNDEVWARMTNQDYEGELVLGVPHDIVYPHIPTVLRRFACEFPRVKINMQSSNTAALKEMFERGKADVILTTEVQGGPDAVLLKKSPLAWFGAPDAQAFKNRPLRLAYEGVCMFRQKVQQVLDEKEIPWEMAVESQSSRAVEATVSADLAITAVLRESASVFFSELPENCGLPELPEYQINMYVASQTHGPLTQKLGEIVQSAYCAPEKPRLMRVS